MPVMPLTKPCVKEIIFKDRRHTQSTSFYCKSYVWLSLTDTSPFPPRVSPSLRPLGCLFMASRLFCWYSSSIVMAATPLAIAPVIRDAAPARPPEKKTTNRKNEQVWISVEEHWCLCLIWTSCDHFCFDLSLWIHSFKDHSQKESTYPQRLQPEPSPRAPSLPQTPLVPVWHPDKHTHTFIWYAKSPEFFVAHRGIYSMNVFPS